MCGLNLVSFTAAFTPAVEIGWRLSRDAWGHGYAREAALAWLNHGFIQMGLNEIVAFTAHSNQPSLALMKRIGMRIDPAENDYCCSWDAFRRWRCWRIHRSAYGPGIDN